uniref:ARAD1C34606p n=1 Tax=Blastobotrys adeninivorans TaxID=409370 RepID=A0A060T881_BLAAD
MKIAFIGGGIFAREYHLPAVLKAGGTLTAVYSRTKKSAAETVRAARDLGYSEQIDIYSDDTSSLDDLLAREDTSGVVIVLPIAVQPDIVRKALKAGKHVLCEKPIAPSRGSAIDLVEEYRKVYAPKGLVFSIAEQFRFDLGYIRARDWVRQGKIGNITAVHARIWENLEPDFKFQTPWRKEPEFQGGYILDAGVHFIALIRMVSGQDITETQCQTAQWRSYLKPIDTVQAVFKLSGGALGTYSHSVSCPCPKLEFLFVGSTGSMQVTGRDNGTTIVLCDADGNERDRVFIDGQPMLEEHRAFVEAIKSGKAEQRASPEEALKDVAVIESMLGGGGQVAT